MNITIATPVEVDTEIARMMDRVERRFADAERVREHIKRIEELMETANPLDVTGDLQGKIVTLRNEEMAHCRAVRDLIKEIAPLDEKYWARKWTRYFLVVSSDGHVHSSPACSTCLPSTEYAWLTEFSGMDEHEFVAEHAKAAACTTCYPWAPVDALCAKTTLELPARRARRLEREKVAAEKAVKKVASSILDVDGSVLCDAEGEIRTLRTARIRVVEHLCSAILDEIYLDQASGYMNATELAQYATRTATRVAQSRATAARLIRAIAAKEGVSVEALTVEFAAKADKKMAKAREEEADRKRKGKTVREYYS